MSRSVVSATSDVASELPTDEHVVRQDLLGELSCSLSGMRTEVCNWEKKLQEVFDDNTLLLATTYQSRSCCHERELCGFVHGDDFIITGDSVQWMWIESRLKEGLNFERCAGLGVDDGVDKMVTILNRLVTWSNQMGIKATPRHPEVLLARMSMDGFNMCIVLCCRCEMQTDTSRNLIVRTSWEFERYANVEILELFHVYIVICQTEEGLMRIMNSYRLTIFLDVKTEVAGFETEPNEESMGHAQARGSIPYGCVKESRYRQRLRWMRACSSFPWRQLAQSWKVDAGYARSVMIVIAEDAGQCTIENVQECSERSESDKYYGTFRNVEDGMRRWTYSTNVVCSAWATTA